MSPIAAAFSAPPFYLPHGFCISWEPTLLMLQVASDSLIALSYYSIPLTLLYFVARRPIPGYTWVPALFAAFILACGTTHLFEIVTLWYPVYWMQGYVKAATAAVSLATAVMIWPLVPRLLALPSPAQLQAANAQLREEVAERRHVETELRGLQQHLEAIVRQRTADLEQTKEDLQREVQERKRIDAFKDELVAMVSHELRTPLTSIAGSLHLLTTDASISRDETRELSEIALRNAHRMTRLVNSLLDIDRIESGRIAFTFAPVALDWLVQTAIHDHRSFARQHGVELAARGPHCGAAVLGDADRLMQVLSNLISNAVRHGPRGSAVEVSLEQWERRVRVAVTDHGPGIPAEYRERVFEKFVQVPRGSSAVGDGVGLGLNIARAIVERHGGTISLATEPGAGTTFFFELPLADAPASQEAAAQEQRLRSS
jgi:signal transduction histidine kinase